MPKGQPKTPEHKAKIGEAVRKTAKAAAKKRSETAKARNNPNYSDGSHKNRPITAKAKTPVTPTNRIRQSPICGAQRRGLYNNKSGVCCQPAGWGTDHPGRGACKWHGGATKGHLKKAMVDQIRETIYGGRLDVTPDQMLLDEVQRCAYTISQLELRLATAEEQDTSPQERLILAQQFKGEREHMLRVVKVAIDSGLQERQVRLAEQEGQLLATVLQAFMTDPDLALTPTQSIAAKGIMRRHLLSIAANSREIQQTPDEEEEFFDLT